MKPQHFIVGCLVIATLSVALAHGQVLKPVVNEAKQRVAQTATQTSKWFDEKVLTPVQSKINKAIDLQKSAIKSLINVDPDAIFSTIFTNITSFNVTQVKECYDMSIGDDEFNIFENSIFDGIRMYYKHFTENFELSKFPDKVKNLFASFTEIGVETVKCIAKPSEYKVGLNQLTDWNYKAFHDMFNDKISEDERQAFNSKYAQRQLDQNQRLDEQDDVDDDNEDDGGEGQSTTAQPERTTRKSIVRNLLGGQATTTLSPNQAEGTSNGYTVQSTPQPQVTTRKNLVNRILGGGSTTTVSPNTQIYGTTVSSSSTTPRPEVTTRRAGSIGGSLFSSVSLNSPEPEELGNKRAKRAIEVDPKCFVRNRSKLPAKLDWNAQGKVTPPKWQGECGSCWSFASIASLESAYLIKGKTRNKKFDLSEQQLLNCATKDGCKGGTSVDAFNYILENKGVPNEKKVPYSFKEKNCGRSPKRNARIKDYCLRGVYVQVNNKTEQLNDQEIQMIVRDFGPVYATMFADEKAMKHYKSGVYNNPTCSKTTNHAITIVGWDKNSWIIKNSWGRGWGEGGFFRMKRGENMCGINTYVTYPIV